MPWLGFEPVHFGDLCHNNRSTALTNWTKARISSRRGLTHNGLVGRKFPQHAHKCQYLSVRHLRGALLNNNGFCKKCQFLSISHLRGALCWITTGFCIIVNFCQFVTFEVMKLTQRYVTFSIIYKRCRILTKIFASSIFIKCSVKSKNATWNLFEYDVQTKYGRCQPG